MTRRRHGKPAVPTESTPGQAYGRFGDVDANPIVGVDRGEVAALAASGIEHVSMSGGGMANGVHDWLIVARVKERSSSLDHVIGVTGFAALEATSRQQVHIAIA